MRLAGVFDDRQAVSRGDLGERVHVHRLPVQVHGHDRGGARRDRGPDGSGVHETVALEAVHEDRRGADVAHGLGGGDEGVGRHDDLVAGTHSSGDQRQLDGVGAGAHPHRVAAAAEGREGLFELREFGAHGVGGALGDGAEGGVELGPQLDGLYLEVDERHVHSRQSVAPVLGSGARKAHFMPPDWLVYAPKTTPP